MAFIAGQYTVKWGGSLIGQIAAGITMEHFVNKRLITGDNAADTPQDAVYRGHEVFAEFICEEYDNAIAKTAFWPYHATLGQQGVIGRTDVGSGLTAVLLLEAIAGTPAAAQPTSITCHRSILAEGFPVRILYAPDLRDIPIRMRLYPNATGDFYTKVFS